MENEIILFDWDDTVFSKTKYKKNLRINLARVCETTEEEIYDFEEKYFNSLAKSDDFRIDNFVDSFAQRFNKKINLKDFSTDDLGIYSGSLFPETIEVINRIKGKYRLGIYSQGFVSLQKLKIKYSGIEDFFKEELLFINRNKLQIETTKQIPPGATIIDDKKEVINALKKDRPDLKLIWINRQTDEVIDGVKTIKSLKELI